MKIEEAKDFIILKTKNDKVLSVIRRLINSEDSYFDRVNLHRSVEVFTIVEDFTPIIVIIFRKEVFKEEYHYTNKKTKLESFLNQLLYYSK